MPILKSAVLIDLSFVILYLVLGLERMFIRLQTQTRHLENIRLWTDSI